ncbi:MAG: hypothetical protein QXP59_03850 [Saccharolobus sp.]
MGEYFYAAVPEFKIKFLIGSRSSLGSVENFDEYRYDFEVGMSKIYDIAEGDVDFIDTDKQINKISIKDLKQLLDFQEIVKSLSFSHPEAILKVISFIKLGLDVDIYSEYDEEKTKKYSSYREIKEYEHD